MMTVSPSGSSLNLLFVRLLAPLAQDAVVLDAHFVLDLLGERLGRRLVLAGAAAHFFWVVEVAAFCWLFSARLRRGLCRGVISAAGSRFLSSQPK